MVFALITEKIYSQIISLNSTVKTKKQNTSITPAYHLSRLYASHLDNGYSRVLNMRPARVFCAARDDLWEIPNN